MTILYKIISTKFFFLWDENLPKDDTNSFPFSYLKTHQISPFFLGIVSFGELATTGLSTVLMVLSQV